MFLCCLFFQAGCGRGPVKKDKPLAVNGIIDLSGWDFKKNGPVNLDGQWEFRRDRLMNPMDFAEKTGQKNSGYMAVPGMWKDQKLDGAVLPGKGTGTYRLVFICAPDEKTKTLTLHRICSAYRLWINGAQAEEKGMPDSPSNDSENYIFIHNRETVSFTPVNGANEIVLQVVNYEYKTGGIGRPLRLENGDVTVRKAFVRHTINMMIVGLVMFFAFYNIIFYFARRKNPEALYMGLFCLILAVNVFNLHLPILSGPLSFPRDPYLLDYLTVIFIVYFTVMTLRAIFPGDYPLPAVSFLQAASALFSIALVFIDFKSAEKLMAIYFVLMILFILYSTALLVMVMARGREDAVLFAVGFIPGFAGGINDVLYTLWIVDTVNVFQYTMVIFCVTTTVIVARRYSRAMRKLSNDLIEKNESLEKLDSLKDQFLANTSHELRTPLHGMIGLSEAMLEGAAGSLDPRARENLSLIASCGHRLSNMVSDLLDMARIQDKGLNLNLRSLDLYRLSEMVVRLSLPLVGDRQLEIINNIRPDIPPVHADEDRIRQVLYNLVGNAIKFTNRGSIELSACISREGDSTGEWIGVSVSDTGIGIPDEYREVIFEPYRQVDGSETRLYQGTGLGLAIARQIIELHGGSIGVKPGAEGGSVFTFTLPVSHDPLPETSEGIKIESMEDPAFADETADQPVFPAGIGEETFTAGPVLLVVDDDPVNIRVIRNYFESRNCTVKAAQDGVSALEIIENDGAVDLVLLDIMMPVMSGYDVCRRIRLSRSPEELPVIMLTAKNMMKDINAAFEAGANDYIVKPFQVTELLARVSTMLKLRKIRRSAAGGITVHAGNRVFSLPFDSIIHVTSYSKNVVVHTREQDIEIPALMKDFADRLPPDIFVRIHKSHIINIRYIHSISHVQSGRYRVRLTDDDDTELPVGRAFLDSLRKKNLN